MIWAASHCVSASARTSTRCSETWRTASTAPLACPETTRTSELNAVLVDQAFDQLCGPCRRGLVVVKNYLQPVRLARDLDSARFVDALNCQVVSILGVLAVDRIFPGKRHRGAQHDRVFLRRRG